MTIFKFKRYKIYHDKKPYYVLVPRDIKDNMWIIDWADDWYGTFIDGTFKALKVLDACFALLGFNPNVIIYFPIKNDRMPHTFTYKETNGTYDIVLMTNRVQLKRSDWKQIRNKLKKAQWTTYKFKFDINRIRTYFGNKTKGLDEIPQEKKLIKAGADTWLYANTAFLCFPRWIYQMESINIYDFIQNDVIQKDYSYCYDEERDHWTCYQMTSFIYGGKPNYKPTYEHPYLTLFIEFYDYRIANRYRKKKDYLVSGKK